MNNNKPQYDAEILAIADYVHRPLEATALAVDTAYHTLLDSLACGLMALDYPACVKLLGPIVPESQMQHGVPIPGLKFELDPVEAAFSIGAMIRWLDFNDTWLAAEWGHPSDNLGAILALSDYLCRHRQRHFSVHNILELMIQAHEIQGVLALENSFNNVGLDHVLLVKVASTAVCCRMLELSHEQTCAALSQAWCDGQALRAYRHAPNTGSRKSWAAGDACARAVRLALITEKGEDGYPSVLSVPRWGFSDVHFNQQAISRKQEYGCYVMENILWKLAFPAEFHAQTAAECAIALHPEVKQRLDDIERIEIETQQAGATIIDKRGPLHNPADRDHCIQYITAISLITGQLSAKDYENSAASNPLIDTLRDKMQVRENTSFTDAYFDPNQRAIGNAIRIHFKDGTQTRRVQIDYPIGHRRRRQEGVPLLLQKVDQALKQHYTAAQHENLQAMFDNPEQLMQLPVTALMSSLSCRHETQVTSEA